MSIDLLKMWQEKARPDPSPADFNVTAGVHFEEVAEMLASVRGGDEYSDLMFDRLHTALTTVALGLKNGTIKMVVRDRKDFLDSLCDQIVTSVGVGHCAKMNIAEAVRRVNQSNFSKFDNDGKPIFNEQGKVMKGPNYKPPQLEGLY
jgi:predicted HAD superfamily Cof-like phosphohydrolase